MIQPPPPRPPPPRTELRCQGCGELLLRYRPPLDVEIVCKERSCPDRHKLVTVKIRAKPHVRAANDLVDVSVQDEGAPDGSVLLTGSRYRVLE